MSQQNEALQSGVGIIVALLGLATLAVLVSPKAKTSELIQAMATAFSSVVKVVVSPVTGS